MRRSQCHTALLGAVVVLWALVAAGCGSADDIVAPDGSTITINPAGADITVDAALANCATLIPRPFEVVLRNGDDQPLNDLEVVLRLTIPGYVFLNTDGSVISPNALGLGEITRVTDDSGKVVVNVGVPACESAADLNASSGTAFSSAHIAVTES